MTDRGDNKKFMDERFELNTNPETEAFMSFSRLSSLQELVPDLGSSMAHTFLTLPINIQNKIIENIQKKKNKVNEGEILNYAVNIINGYAQFGSMDPNASDKTHTEKTGENLDADKNASEVVAARLRMLGESDPDEK